MYDIYKSFIRKRIKIKLNDNSSIEGDLISIDGYLNLALQHVLLYEEGIGEPFVFRSCLVKGSNVECIAL
ncbi:putative Like-Sm ribonucleoprotein (LSM) domain protein [Trachipleistophora hominis]|uniref:Putative Like-Sm ribonucleoprotein (LSM) domain protein n=1 Tax=Trachipleistophora hominis TaxID=72359 RepID=L7JXP5_TRAHO|nr:putative Like-Sm ribonucleoprotein (LSM) domain protein [Trachipleistophora hominis]